MKILGVLQRDDPPQIAHFYGVEPKGKDAYDLLEEIAIAKRHLIRGGEPDIDKTARMIISDWQKGKTSLAGQEISEEINEEEQ